MRFLSYCFIVTILVVACGPNREVSIDQGPGVREIHDSIEVHFDEVVVNGVEYLILEKDRNNPDEGFGFMALKGNLLVHHTDSAIAYLKTMLEVQAKILAKLDTISERQASREINRMLSRNLRQASSFKADTGSLTGTRRRVSE